MFEYTKPEVEVIIFVARERLATATASPDLPLTVSDEDLSFSEGVGSWDNL